jgi:hypothetical protein
MRPTRWSDWMVPFVIAILVCACVVVARHQPDPTWLKAVGMSDGNDEDVFMALVWNQSLVPPPSIAIYATPEHVLLVEPPMAPAPAFVPAPALVSRAPPASIAA